MHLNCPGLLIRHKCYARKRFQGYTLRKTRGNCVRMKTVQFETFCLNFVKVKVFRESDLCLKTNMLSENQRTLGVRGKDFKSV